MDFTDKSIVITGASGGIGLEISTILSREKCKLALLSRSIEKLQKFASEYGSSHNIILPIQCDVSKKEQVNSALDKVIETFGGIDIVILNAAIGVRSDPENFSAETGEKIFRVNLISSLYFFEKLLPLFIKKKSGMIIGISSQADTRGFPRSGFYNASKAAFTRLLESLRIELKGYGVKVITVRPGFVKTHMTEKNEFYMPLLMNAEKAARIIVKGIRKEKRVIQFPFLIAIGTKLLGLLPGSWFEFSARKHLEGLKRKEL
jgi:short-subunit dehydrogenase